MTVSIRTRWVAHFSNACGAARQYRTTFHRISPSAVMSVAHDLSASSEPTRRVRRTGWQQEARREGAGRGSRDRPRRADRQAVVGGLTSAGACGRPRRVPLTELLDPGRPRARPGGGERQEVPRLAFRAVRRTRFARCGEPGVRAAARGAEGLKERYHHVKRTPTEVRRALAYVLLNIRKHHQQRRRRIPPVVLDGASSGLRVRRLAWAVAASRTVCRSGSGPRGGGSGYVAAARGLAPGGPDRPGGGAGRIAFRRIAMVPPRLRPGRGRRGVSSWLQTV